MEQHNFINFPEMDFLEYSFFTLSDKSPKNKNNHRIYPVNNTFFFPLFSFNSQPVS